MDLEIIVKTCDTNSLSSLPRICGENKLEIINKCFTSLVLSAGQANKLIKLTVVDDNSTSECTEMIQKILSKSFKKNEFIKMDNQDFKAATLKTFEIARDSDATLVYLVEDDYLHEPNSIQEMLNFYEYAFNQLNKTRDIILSPFDDPSNYIERFNETSHIVLGERRHWRTNTHANCTFMTTPSIIRRNWINFERFVNEFNGTTVTEFETIDPVWNLPSSNLFTPIPSMAFHMHDEQRADRLVAWKQLWDYVPDITKN